MGEISHTGNSHLEKGKEKSKVRSHRKLHIDISVKVFPVLFGSEDGQDAGAEQRDNDDHDT